MSFGNNVYNTLNAVTTTAWIPAITFGGGNTGITYSIQSGSYNRIGNVVFYRFTINLSNKGSSTGAAKITGLPFTSSLNIIGQMPQQTALDLDANYTTFFCKAEAGTTNLELFQTGATSTEFSKTLNDTNFNNTTLLSGSGFYFV